VVVELAQTDEGSTLVTVTESAGVLSAAVPDVTPGESR